VLTLYRRRWQVEQAFKRLKSLIGLEDLRVHDSELVGVWIHIILLVALLIDNERPSLHRERPVSPRRAPRVGSQFRSGDPALCCASLRPQPWSMPPGWDQHFAVKHPNV
jgi:hypothetical protein